jgi:hypothetical protein
MKYVGFAVGLGLALVVMIYNWPTMLSQPSPFQEARASVHQIFDHDDEHSNCSGVMAAPAPLWRPDSRPRTSRW